MDDAVRLRGAHPDEAGALTRLALASKAVWGYGEALRDQFLNELTITPEFIRRNLVFVADNGGRDPLAVGAIRELGPGIVDLDFMFVAPAAMRQGIGRRLFARLCDEARTLGYTTMSIQADPHAVGFYEAMGAVRVGEQQSMSVPGRMLPLFHYAL